jgi:hypothetical protein
MLSFQPKKPSKGVGFTLDPVARERAKAPANRRRHLHLVFLLGIAVVCGALLWSFVDRIGSAIIPATNQLKQELPLAPMARPSIAELPPLPDAAAIAEHAAGVPDQLANGTVPLWVDQPDASTLAWIRAVLERDRTAPELPQRVSARDLVMRHLKVGSTVVLTGMLEDSQPAPIAGQAEGYQRLLLGLPDQQYVEVLAPESARELVIGDRVHVVGRYLGFASLPPADPPAPTEAAPAAQPTGEAPSAAPAPAAAPAPKAIALPLIAARVATVPAKQVEQDNPYVMRGAWSMPEDIYRNVDDDLLIVETRPYYFTLGQVQLDRTSPEAYRDAPSANAMGSAIHKEPSKFRGQPFTVRGHVFHAWEDEGVAHDHPFGVDRVVRIIMWNEDWGEWEERDRTGEVKISRKLILRAFEVAAVTHQPLPQPGDILTTQGRFLRLRAMEVSPNPNRDRILGFNRHSDRAHTFLFVTGEFSIQSPLPQYDWTWLKVVVVVASLALAGLLLYLARRESRHDNKVFDSVRRLRQTRHELKRRNQPATEPPADPAPPSPTDPTAGPSAP